MQNQLILLILSLFLLTCSKESVLSEPHIRVKKQIGFYVNSEANLISETAIRETFQKWGQATHFEFRYKGRNRAGLKRDHKNTVSFLKHWPKDIPINKVGYCRNWYNSKGHIVESDIILNMQVTRFTTLRTRKPDSYILEGVLAHEIGHLIGLGHSTNSNSIMKQTSSMSESYFKANIDSSTIDTYKKLYLLK